MHTQSTATEKHIQCSLLEIPHFIVGVADSSGRMYVCMYVCTGWTEGKTICPTWRGHYKMVT